MSGEWLVVNGEIILTLLTTDHSPLTFILCLHTPIAQIALIVRRVNWVFAVS